jgi:hypothetical protein
MKKYFQKSQSIGLRINLCEGCADMLDEYNPYITPDGDPIPRELIEVNIVPIKQCDNYLITK